MAVATPPRSRWYPYQRDFLLRFNRAGAAFPAGYVTSFYRGAGAARDSQHRFGLALDVAFPGSPSRWPVRQLRAAMEAQGLVVVDERRGGSDHWTGPHLHVQRFPAGYLRSAGLL